MRNKIIAIMYDFDKTLCTKNTQEYTFIPSLGIDSDKFWQEADNMQKKYKMDPVLCYMYLMYQKSIIHKNPIKREHLRELGKDIELFPGVISWFDRINKYGEEKGIKIEHYIISSGLKEIIEGTSIGDKFDKIFASEYFYNNDGIAIWPNLAVNYTNKTQFLSRINKGVLDISDINGLNDKMLDNERRISTSNMIYIGDGFTDVPCMKLTKEGGGVSIAVYTDDDDKVARKLLNDGRIDFMVPSDYCENSEIEVIIKKVIDKMTINTELVNETYKKLGK